MKEQFYGSVNQSEAGSELDRHVEEISLLGFTVVKDVVPSAELEVWRKRIDAIYELQERKESKAYLDAIHETDVCRAPLLYDQSFLALATQSKVLAIVRAFLGDWFILNLQNAIINRANLEHHQSSWHRDLPYQNYVISRPLAINALFAIDEFSKTSGGTIVVPYTHKTEVLPSDAYIEKHKIVAEVPAGSAVVFDSMLFHRAGYNSGTFTRRAVNHLYTTPIMKQQYDFPQAMQDRVPEDPFIARLLGLTSVVPRDDTAWRTQRGQRLGVTRNG